MIKNNVIYNKTILNLTHTSQRAHMEQSKMHINNEITNKLTLCLVSWIDSYEAITLFFLKHIDQTNGNLLHISI